MKMKDVDMLGGSLWKNTIYFAIPVILSGILQLLFNACDMIVVGRFSGSEALAAVGATGALTNLLVNLFIGLSVGVNVLAAQFFGARDYENVQKVVHTAIALSLICGVLLAALGILVCRPCLVAMNTPEDVIDLATLYMRIYFMGVPFMLLYNFGAGILRAHGNTKQPLIFLAIAGLVNVILNLILVIVFHMSVEGVAIATAISQVVSASLVIHCLRDPASVYHLDFRRVRVHRELLGDIFRIGIPAGVNGMLFSFSNMQIQSSINIFGSQAMAGGAAASNLDGFIYVATNAFHQSAINFTGQNVGAGQVRKVPKILRVNFIYATVVALVLGGLVLFFGPQLLGLYTSDAAAAEYGLLRLSIIAPTYFLCGYMDVLTGVLRGMGYSLFPTIVTLVGTCGLRIGWIATIFQVFKSLKVLYLVWPVSWFVTAFVLLITYLWVMHKQKKTMLQETA